MKFLFTHFVPWLRQNIIFWGQSLSNFYKCHWHLNSNHSTSCMNSMNMTLNKGNFFKSFESWLICCRIHLLPDLVKLYHHPTLISATSERLSIFNQFFTTYTCIYQVKFNEFTPYQHVLKCQGISNSGTGMNKCIRIDVQHISHYNTLFIGH